MPDTNTTEVWEVLEEEDFNIEGYVLVPTDPAQKGSVIFGGPPNTAACLFPSIDDAKDGVVELTKRGMPIGFAKPAKARLSLKKKLQVSDCDEPAASSLIIIGGK